MSRSDFPPGYDSSHAPLYAPPGGDYPPPPAYGFPGYGVPPPGQHSAPYPSDPYGSPYPGQPAGYPAGGYPGQPAGYPAGAFPGQPAGYPAGGFPGQPAGYPAGGQPAGYPAGGQPHPAEPGPGYRPPMIPPVMPSSVLSGDGEGFAAGNFDSLKVRHAFIRKVYMILAAQLLVTVAIVAVFTFVDSVKVFVRQNPAIYYSSFGVYIVTTLVLVCCKGPRRKFPWNIILLAIFTLAMSYMTGTISSYYDTKAVFLALGITVIVCVITTVFCFQTKVDLTSCTGLFCVLGIVVFVAGIITAIVLSVKYIPWLHMVYAAVGAVVYTLFLAYHTQLLIGKGKNSISPEEYVFAALSIYIDVVQLFMCLLQLIGAANR